MILLIGLDYDYNLKPTLAAACSLRGSMRPPRRLIDGRPACLRARQQRRGVGLGLAEAPLPCTHEHLQIDRVHLCLVCEGPSIAAAV